VGNDGILAARFGRHQLALGDEVVASRPRLRTYAGRRVILGVRPEDIAEGAGARGSTISVSVDIREDMGAEVYLHFGIDAPPVQLEALKEIAGEEAAEAAEIQAHEHGVTWIARVARGALAREGERAELTVNTALLHFFELETGAAIFS
jgi:multiple sugar transport system ATP-binding protein